MILTEDATFLGVWAEEIVNSSHSVCFFAFLKKIPSSSWIVSMYRYKCIRALKVGISLVWL